VVNSNITTGGDISCSGVYRGKVIQLGMGGLPVKCSMTPGVYFYSGRLVLDDLGNFYPNDAVNFQDLTSGCVSINTIPSLAAF
jgi:hypothetical protein